MGCTMNKKLRWCTPVKLEVVHRRSKIVVVHSKKEKTGKNGAPEKKTVAGALQGSKK